MNIRNLVLTLLAAATLSGCYTGYGYRGGAGDYYYGQPSVDYYGYGGYDYGYGGYGGYGYPYGYYGYYPGYYPGYYYPPWYTHNPRPPHPDHPSRPGGVLPPDSGVRYPSRAQGALERSQRIQTSPQSLPPSQGRYPSRVPQVRSGLETRGGPAQAPPPARVQPPAPRFESRTPSAEPRFESRPPRMDSGSRNPVRSGSSSRERDRGRVQNP